MLLCQVSLLHGQLALFQFNLESLTPTESSLRFEGHGDFPIRLNFSLFLGKITTSGNIDSTSFK